MNFFQRDLIYKEIFAQRKIVEQYKDFGNIVWCKQQHDDALLKIRLLQEGL